MNNDNRTIFFLVWCFIIDWWIDWDRQCNNDDDVVVLFFMFFVVCVWWSSTIKNQKSSSDGKYSYAQARLTDGQTTFRVSFVCTYSNTRTTSYYEFTTTTSRRKTTQTTKQEEKGKAKKKQKNNSIFLFLISPFNCVFLMIIFMFVLLSHSNKQTNNISNIS